MRNMSGLMRQMKKWVVVVGGLLTHSSHCARVMRVSLYLAISSDRERWLNTRRCLAISIRRPMVSVFWSSSGYMSASIGFVARGSSRMEWRKSMLTPISFFAASAWRLFPRRPLSIVAGLTWCVGDVSLCGGVHIVLRSAVWCVVRWWAGRGGGCRCIYILPKLKQRKRWVSSFVTDKKTIVAR